jgi:glycosyltransferase involved in cell wall biosynthesis
MATFGREMEIECALQSLLDQTDKGFELIVVDQNTDDRVTRRLAPLQGSIALQHLHHDKPNLSVARNLGLKCARGAIVAFPDDDCWYERDVVERVRQRFADNNELDAVVACWVEIDTPTLRSQQLLSLSEWRRFRAGHAASCMLFLKRERLEALGGFDPRLGTGQWYGSSEDTDLVLRLLGQGALMLYVPDVRIHHAANGPRRLSIAECARSRRFGRGIGALYVKHGLPVWIVIRGLIGPIGRAVFEARPMTAIVLGVCTSFGRLEGMVRWFFDHRPASKG